MTSRTWFFALSDCLSSLQLLVVPLAEDGYVSRVLGFGMQTLRARTWHRKRTNYVLIDSNVSAFRVRLLAVRVPDPMFCFLIHQAEDTAALI